MNILPLQRSIALLEEGLKRCSSNPDDDLLRDGLIFRFKRCYDLSYRALKLLCVAAPIRSRDQDSILITDLLRSAQERGLLNEGLSRWKVFHDIRTKATDAHSDELAVG